MTPLLGDGYNKWLPEIVLIFALITFCNLHGRILRLFNIKHYSYFEAIAPNDEDIDEGKGIIDQGAERLYAMASSADSDCAVS